MPPALPPPLPAFHHPTYLVRRKIFKLLGAAFHIYDPAGNVAFYSKQKAFKLKEDIRIYSGEDQRQELLVIKARNILDIAATYDVFDPNTGNAHVGCVKRKGLKSIMVDEWVFMNPAGREIGLIKEDSLLLALLRRIVAGWLLPQEYNGSIGNAPVCRFKRNFNPFVSKVTLDFTSDTEGLLDRRLGIAAAVLLVAIENKQS
jgi:hypothetical protein